MNNPSPLMLWNFRQTKKNWIQSILIIIIVAGFTGFGLDQASALQGKFKNDVSWRTITNKNGLVHDKVNVIKAIQEQVFIGTDKGLAVYNKQSKTFKTKSIKDGLPHERILSLYHDDKILWIGTKAGLGRLNVDDKELKIENLGLKELSIQCLSHGQGEDLLLGTNQGLHFYQLAQKKNTLHKELGKVSIVDIAKTNDGVLVLRDKGQVIRLIWNDKDIQVLEIKANPLQRKVKALIVSGDGFWFATDGRGLIKYDLYEDEWSAPSNKKDTGTMLSSLVADGQFVWTGAFHGLYQYDSFNEKWIAYYKAPFEQHSITSLAIDGAQLWVGTNGGGIVQINKKYPFIASYIDQRIFKNQTVSLNGEVKGQEPLSVTVEYRSRWLKNIWFTQHAQVKQRVGQFTGTLDFSALLDGLYQIKINVADKAGQQNNSVYTLIKSTQPLDVKFDENFYRVGKNFISGTYKNQTIKAIWLEPGHVPAKVDKLKRTFVGQVNLTEKSKQIQAVAIDLMDRQITVQKNIDVKPAAEIDVVANKPSFNSGDEKVGFAITHKQLDEVEEWNFKLTDSDGNLIYEKAVDGELKPSFEWDGHDHEGNVAPPGRLYKYVVSAKEENGLEVVSKPKMLRSSLQVVKKEHGYVINIDNAFLFDSGKAKLKEQQYFIFDELAEILKGHTKSMIMVEGHTDNRPINTKEFPSNTILSKARARSVTKEIMKRIKISKDRITAVGYGETKPIASNKSAIGRANNRRVEIILVITK